MVDVTGEVRLAEGEVLNLPIAAADADGDRLTVTVHHLPAGAVFDAATGLLTWVPGYDQAGAYHDVTIVATDGKATVNRRFNITVEPGHPQPILTAVAPQILREGEKYALQLAGSLPGEAGLADGTRVTLEYATPWLPGGATLNAETGWFEWTPGYHQHGTYRVPVSLIATWTAPDGETTTTTVTRDVVFNVANANGAPIFAAAETWNILEGQPLRVSVFAFDPDNPEFEPKVRLQPGADAVGPETTAPTVTYQVAGLPEGASFDPETMEIVWTPGYTQDGTYSVTVTATDDGDGTGMPAVSQVVVPIVVTNANRAPDLGDIQNAFVDKGGVLEIPVTATDIDGNPIELTFSGLPRFATYTQSPSAGNGSASGVLRFAPGDGDRGDYPITVTASDNGDGNVNQILSQAKSFVVTVKSLTEAPVITAPRQVVARVGQPLSVALLASDLDQDALTWTTHGLPLGAELVEAAQYGHATLTWTPTADDIGARDVELIVTDSGLPPQDAGYTHPDNPVPNVTRQTLRIVVRQTNTPPDVLGVEVNGQAVSDHADTPIRLNATEGVPLSLTLYGRDADADRLNWTVDGLPRGMAFTPAADGGRASFAWTPDRFAAQDSNTGTPGLWRLTVTGSDGAAAFTRTLEISVANVNQTPRLLPLPLQLVHEGETLNFTVRGADADNDAIQLSLVHDDTTPAGVFFDASSGTFEWTPGQEVVNNASAADQAYTFTFQASDGTATTTQTVQVRVFDVNRLPRLTATNHAVVIGDTLSLPVTLGGTSGNGIQAVDDDGAAQTQALAVSFTHLPEGAAYDAQTQRLTWTPGPGQIGDTTVTARVSDGKNVTTATFTLRVVAEAAANRPKIVVSTTPSLPALPGQTLIASVRADAWSGIAGISADRREGEGGEWQPVTLDAAGRVRFVPTQPGLIELRVTATDRDGFQATQVHTVRVKDPADTSAPQLAWTGALTGRQAHSEPVILAGPTALAAHLTEAQLMGWRLQLAPAGSDAWQALAQADTAAGTFAQPIELATLDPRRYANGVYRLRLTAWDLAGRTGEIEARVIVDGAEKDFAVQTESDGRVTLAGHALALTRTWSEEEGGEARNFGNWRLPLLETRLTSDQPAADENGASLGELAPWQEGARLWLSLPADLADPRAPSVHLSFILDTQAERLGGDAGAPQVWHPVFTGGQGWQLDVRSDPDGLADDTRTADPLVRLGSRLYNQTTGLPWAPAGFTLTGPDGTRYTLDAQGRITDITFADGNRWLVSDAGVAALAANGDPAERLDIQRDSTGRIARLVTPDGQGGTTAIVYRYDGQGRLLLVRRLAEAGMGSPIAYDAQGKPFTGTLTANLGAVVNWGADTVNRWSGELTAGTTATLAFAVRDSEMASTVKVPGGQGAVIVALESSLPADAQIEVSGAQIIGTATVNGKTTRLLRVTEGGVKLIRLSGVGPAGVRLALAGDLNRDGRVDGADSAAWDQAAGAQAPIADINGDGEITSADRQVLFANTGFKANRAPISNAVLPTLKTHADLGVRTALASIAEDLEGDSVFWRILGSTHGTAKLNADGRTLAFTPEASYTGEATIRLQADDGFAAGAPIELKVNVSGAKLLQLHLAQLPTLYTGQLAQVHATADFEDEQGAAIAGGSYLTVTAADLGSMGYVGANAVQVDDARDLIRATEQGPALVIVKRIDTDGRLVQAVAAINVQAAPLPVDPNATDESDSAEDALVVQPDVYPGMLTLIPGGTRQLKVHLVDQYAGEQTDIHTASQTVFAGAAEHQESYTDPTTGQTTEFTVPILPPVYSGTRYVVSDETVATVSEDGLITALRAGQVTISIIHLASATNEFGSITEQVIGQTDIRLTVEAAQVTDDNPDTGTPAGIVVAAGHGGVVQAATGETVMIGAGVLKEDTTVSIQRIDVAQLESLVGMPAPAVGALQAIGAFKLDIGTATSGYPLQLAIPAQGDLEVTPGDEIVFFKKGKVLTANGDWQETWWLVDNGFIGADGVARTASPPYSGLDESGEYVVCKKLPGVIADTFELMGGVGDWITFGGANFSFGFGLMEGAITSAMIGIAASMATTATAARYHFGVPQFADITLPQVPTGETYRINATAILPPAPTPYGNVVIPNLSDASVDDSGVFKITVQNDNPGQFAGKMVVRALYANGSHKDVKELAGNFSGQIAVTPPSGVAIGSVRWQVVRLISTAQLSGSGSFTDGEPLEFAGNILRIAPKPDMAAVLTRTGVEFVRQNHTVASVNLLDKLGSPNNLNGTYLTGGKVQPVVFTDDLSTVYVAGNGVVFAIDMLTFQVIDTIAIPAGCNISSLATVGSLLVIGEGKRYGGGGGNRLLVMDIDPGSSGFKQVVSLKDTGIESTPYGVSGMTVGPDGKTLVVGAPMQSITFGTADPAKRGSVLVLDLSTLDLKTGQIATPVKVELPADGRSGKTPQVITATRDPNRYLVADISDYDKGLATLALTRNDQGKVTGAKMNAISMFQPDSAIRIDRLNIQRAQSAVLVEYGGVEYAIVADDNYDFMDPYYRAMYEAPTFIYTPSGPPLAFGGSASAKKVAVGGKLGIVQDPFGSTPKFLGATLPLDGYGIMSLAASEDSKVLIGQLLGKYSSIDFGATQQPHQSHAWSVAALIDAALAMPEKDRLSKHIRLPKEAEQLISNQTGWPIGSFFDAEDVKVKVEGRMGDVIEVDLKRLIAHELLKLPAPGNNLSQADKDKIAAKKTEIEQLIANLSVDFVAAEKNKLTEGDNRGMILVDKKDNDKTIVSRSDAGADAKFEDTGRFFVAPNLKPDDMKRLRAGDRVLDKEAKLELSYTLKKDVAGIEKGTKKASITITAKDYAKANGAVFFGDRPLENPGYSEFELKGKVGVGQSNDTLEVYRVEQRLKYLGFPAIGTNDPRANNTIQDFMVDGDWTAKEAHAALLFDKVVNYGPGNTQIGIHPKGKKVPVSGAAAYFVSIDTAANAESIAAGSKVLKYLNSYNAPHWMNIGPQMSSANKGAVPLWTNTQDGTGTRVESYGTSWMRDLFVAKNSATLLNGNRTFRFNGGVDANLGYTPFTHATHDLGMSFDLGIRDYVGDTAQRNDKEVLLDAINKLSVDTWNVNDAINYSALLPAITSPAAQLNNQQAALRDFLSLYSVVRSDSSQPSSTWDKLTFANTKDADQIRTALFGDGSLAGSLISQVHIGGQNYTKRVPKKDPTTGKVLKDKNGKVVMETITVTQNSFPNIRAVLNSLGFSKVTPVQDHQNHFHVYLKPPAAMDIGGAKKIEAEDLLDQAVISSNQENVSSSELSIDALMTYVQSAIGPGEHIMFVMDAPYDSLQESTIVVAQAASIPASDGRQGEVAKNLKPNYVVFNCQQVENRSDSDPTSADRSIDPIGLIRTMFEKNNGSIDEGAISVKILQGPKHGKITTEIDNTGYQFFAYAPNPNYFGKDSVIFLATLGNKVYKIVSTLQVLRFAYDRPDESPCPVAPQSVKISEGTMPYLGNQSSYSFPSIAYIFSFADLSGATLAQTTATNITLSSNAADHGWFVDATPELNEEYLPTSNSLEWIAKPGSEAEGKMDLLTVLLHEYGHAVGLEHTVDSHDLMASTLLPGVRRLPSATELQALRGLLFSGGSAPLPYDPFNLPGTPMPVSRSLSMLRTGRLRPTGLVGLTGGGSEDFTRFDTAANSTLENTDFTSGQGWATTGNIAFANGSARLTETAATQTRLNQAFVLGEHDRFLSFTVTDAALDNVDGAPDDAFEAALVDTSTGLSLLSGTGLTHNDAFLNLQADGTEHAAEKVTSIRNADGSRTYLVDLAGIAAGTVVNLSFDLIGFGRGAAATSSHLTIRDLRIGVPQTKDDSLTLAEDTPTTVAALDNDLNAQQPGFAAVIVDGPAHGQVSINADGTFSFVPDKDWYGEDKFTYKLSDGHVDSNIATVSLTVTPVNDAPVTADDGADIQEDGALVATGNVLANDSDVDVDTVLAVAEPGTFAGTYGTLTLAADGSYTYTLANDSLVVQALRAGEVVSDTFAYAASDGLISTPALLTVTITGQNDAPVTADDGASVEEDGTLTATGNLLGNDSDVDTGTALSVAEPGTFAGTYGTLSVAGDGSYIYTLANDSLVVQALRAGEVVTDVFAYAAGDGLTTTPAQLTVTITGQNDAPVTSNDTGSVQEDGTLSASGNLLANDSDVDKDTTLTVAEPATYTGTYGTLVVNGDGWYTYTLDNASPAVQGLRAGQVVADVFVYAASDGITRTPATLTIRITGTNDGPLARDDTAQAREDGGAFTFDGVALLANDIDADVGDSQTIVSVTDSTGGAQVRLLDGNVVYDVGRLFQSLNDGQTATDTFTYTMVDGEGAASTATVTVTVFGVNDAPVAVSSTVVGQEDTPYVFAWSDFQASDVDNEALTLTITSAPADGELQLLDGTDWSAIGAGQAVARAAIEAGHLRFVPDNNESGSPEHARSGLGNRAQHYAQFAYQVSDGQLTSAVVTMTVDIVAAADAPVLALESPTDSSRFGATNEMFRTGWESATNGTPTFTLVKESQFEGWTLVTDPAGNGPGQQVFEIWSSGDNLPDGQNHSTVYAATGNGRNWLELNDGQGQGHQTLGIERTVTTQAGASYALSFDYAGQVGYGAEATRIGIYVDGVKIGTYANTSPNGALNWQNLQFGFAGAGGSQTIRIVIETGATAANGRGAMIDDIALTEQWPLNTGYANTPVRLSAITTSLADLDGSETLAIAIQALPVGSILSDGTRSFAATAGNTTAQITGWNLGQLSLLPPANTTGSFDLCVVATATESANGSSASTTALLTVTVKPAAAVFQSPLVLDLNGDGVRTTALGETTGRFDLLSTGTAIDSGWVSPEDAFLAVDLNGNGRIDDRSELFGGEVGEGFAQLASFDSNGDGVVDAQDERFKELLLWQDADSNHETGAGELRTLSEGGISSLNISYRIVPEMQSGNLLLERSFATRADGTVLDVVDVYFRIERTAEEETQTTSEAPEPTGPWSASITVRSDLPPSLDSEIGPISASASSLSLPDGNVMTSQVVIDWNATSSLADSELAGGDDWLRELLGTPDEQAVDLATLTGLKVTLSADRSSSPPLTDN